MSASENNAHNRNLHRSRSTTSVQDRKKHPLLPKPLDPETSRVHAIIAAHRAMDRSQSRSSADIIRSNSNESHRTATTAAKSQNVCFPPATHLRRQRSTPLSLIPHLSAGSRVPAESQHDDPYVDVVASGFGAVTENYGAEPSSYRRIRRARSMLTPRRRLFGNPSSPIHTPFSPAPTVRTAKSSTALAQPGLGLRIKRSLMFLRPNSRAPVPPRPDTHVGHNDEAVTLARTKFLSDVEDTLVYEKASLLHLPKIRRPQKAFRKSVRSSQLKDTDESRTSDTPSFDAPMLAQSKRSFSASLRDRFLRTFGKSLTNKSSLPPQQLEATRRHFGDTDEGGLTSSFDDYHVEQKDDCRESVYVPSGPDVETDEDKDGFSLMFHTAGSRESLHPNARSRVTSWANSSMTSSTTRGPGLERNRLSIIKEDAGPAQPSCSAGRHIGGISVFQHPLDSENEEGQPYPPVDSQRIYSALMKRIGEEEAEMEETKTALEEIQQGRTLSCDPFGAGKSTIRAVSSTPLCTEAIRRDASDGSSTEHPLKDDSSAMTPALHMENIENRKAKLALQEEQSSFFPFSDQGKTQTPSPFRKLLEQRRSDSQSENDSFDHPMKKHEKPARGLTRCKSDLTSESIYSQTTNGGDNPSHIPPVGSAEELATVIQDVDEDTGMATIIPARYRVVERSKLSSADSSERRQWKGWMEGEIDASLGRRDHSRTGIHYREHAQIDSDNVYTSKSEAVRPGSKGGATSRFPLLDLKEVSRSNTPAPKRSSSLTKSQSGLLKRASTVGLNSPSECNDENKKLSTGIRKLSPGNIANMLREKRSQVVTTKLDNVDKENKPVTTDSPRSSSPAVSTPGRLRLQMKSGNGRLRKRASDTAVRPNQKHHVNPKNVSTPLQHKANGYDESPTDRVKPSLSARLTRPSSLNVPEQHQASDSMSPGEKELGFAIGRLSTALNAASKKSKGYVGLGPNPFDGADTALPRVRTPNGGQALDVSNSSEKSKGGWSSKRMVSDFLRKRRLGRSTSTKEAAVSTEEVSSPAAFV